VDPAHQVQDRPATQDVVGTAMLGLLGVQLRRHGRTWRLVSAETVEVTGTEPRRVALTDLRRRMMYAAKAEWPDIVEDTVTDLLDPRGHTTDVDWASARQMVRALLIPSGDLRSDGTSTSDDPRSEYESRTLEPGLAEALTLALPEHLAADAPSSTLVTRRDLAHWGVSAATAYRVARANVRADGPLDCELARVDGGRISLITGSGSYTASHVWWLPEYIDMGPSGALVALPHRHMVCACPVDDAGMLGTVGAMLRFVRREFETSPGALSDQLYWWHQGSMSVQPVEHSHETIRLRPTPEFAAVLDRLRRDR
jgi:hypothetical protein